MDPPSPKPSLKTIPPEVLEHIALFVATQQLKGPPSDLASLCRTCKIIHDTLSFSCNLPLYASIFRFKFDIAAPIRRLGTQHVAVSNLAVELRRRFEAMQRIRKGMGSQALVKDHAHREHDLWMAVLMMLENDGKNAVQLKGFGSVGKWLHTYFLEATGGSYIQHDMGYGNWPRNNNDNSLALFLLALCDADGTSLTPPSKLYSEILRTYTIAANKYPLTQSSWTEFWHTSTMKTTNRAVYRHFDRQTVPTPPAIALSAILGYIARIKQPAKLIWAIPPESSSSGVDGSQPTPRRQAWDWGSIEGSFSQRWDCDWERCIGTSDLGDENMDLADGLKRFYRPGILEGTWEGLFTYPEFGVYAAILSGEPPQTVSDGAIGQNLQVWRLREYNLYSYTSEDMQILPPGEAYNAFFPNTTLVENGDSVVFTHGSQRVPYQRAVPPAGGSDHDGQRILRDVIVLGEGHSSWGDFKLRGRVRASDAFVTILKEYDGPDDRGRWLYRGYLVGGRYVGRWRDILTPMEMVGYEGGFELCQRI